MDSLLLFIRPPASFYFGPSPEHTFVVGGEALKLVRVAFANLPDLLVVDQTLVGVTYHIPPEFREDVSRWIRTLDHRVVSLCDDALSLRWIPEGDAEPQVASLSEGCWVAVPGESFDDFRGISIECISDILQECDLALPLTRVPLPTASLSALPSTP